MKTHIRAAVTEDLKAIVAIAAHSPTAPQWSLKEFATMLAADETSPLLRRVLVAEHGGEVAGFAVYTVLRSFFPSEAELESLAVGPLHRRLGLGKALLAAVNASVASFGAESLLLEVRASNAGAIALYRGAGFTPAGIRKDYYASPKEDAMCMRYVFANQGVHESNEFLAKRP
jgi:ribosomal-protein-alanine N-acetyltransferase